MRHLSNERFGAFLLLLSLMIGFGGTVVIKKHQRDVMEGWQFERIEAYMDARSELDIEIDALEQQMQTLSASVAGSVVLMFDQCAPNAYDIVYAQLREFDMTGSLVFRDTLPGDAGAVTKEQWTKMQDDGWSAVLGSSEELLASLSQSGYADRLVKYAEAMSEKFTSLGFIPPVAYSFAEGEYSTEAVDALRKIGFYAFSSPEAETAVIGEDGAVFRELYLSSGPNAPILQGIVENVKNAADVLVIKTRYVHEIEDPNKDTELSKFRAGMLNSLSGYRNAGSIEMETMESAPSAYREAIDAVAVVEKKRSELQARIDQIEAELRQLWKEYRVA